MEGFNFNFNIPLGHKSQEVLLAEIIRGCQLVSEFGKRLQEANNGYCPNVCMTFNFTEKEEE